jgi:molybdopterin-guanine dinucleotide biosynthesis protein B
MNISDPLLTPVIGFAACSGTGKTTLLTGLIPQLTKAGLRIAIIKHSHHDFELDQPGKDSYRLHHAGSCQTLLTSKYRSALIHENKPQKEPSLKESIHQLDHSCIDLILVEGFRHEPGLSKIELHRPILEKPLLYLQDKNIIAIASDAPLETTLPVLDLNNPAQIARFIGDHMSILRFIHG